MRRWAFSWGMPKTYVMTWAPDRGAGADGAAVCPLAGVGKGAGRKLSPDAMRQAMVREIGSGELWNCDRYRLEGCTIRLHWGILGHILGALSTDSSVECFLWAAQNGIVNGVIIATWGL